MKLEVLEILNLIITHVIFIGALGFYLIVNLQWYHYKISRVLTKHHKIEWHFLYFVLPTTLYFFSWDSFFWIFFYFGYIPSLYLWYKKLDKKLVFTMRVKRFLGLLLFLTIFQDLICLLKEACQHFGIFMPIIMTVFGSIFVEKFIFISYYNQARNKLSKMPDLKIIAITGSYGKTSIKNFTAELLSKKYRVYATPRSVNTIGGIVVDINNSLPEDTQIYVCEAGARQRGDIYEISTFLNPQYVVVSKVGEAHIEYFKSIKNTISAKLEIMQSARLKKAFIHSSVTNEPHEKVEFFGNDVKDIEATLEFTKFKIDLDGEICEFKTDLLGAFQAENISVAIKLAKEFGLSNQEIIARVSRLTPVEHRLQKITAGGKIILDDGYNGNIDGMLSSYELVNTYRGKKIVVTPGIVEANEELNQKLAKKIDEVFDLVIITSDVNHEVLAKFIPSGKRKRVYNKKALELMLANETKAGDLILFSNDAPNFL